MFPRGPPETFSRTSRKPSPYPTLPFHLLKTSQLLAAFIVGAILSFFVDHLRDEGYGIPWTFLFVRPAPISVLEALS